MNPTRLALRRPVTMTMFVLALVLMGVISYTFLPVQQLPSVNFTFVAVVVSYPGASPADVENSITLPLENAISGVAGIQTMSGLSALGVSRIALQFAEGTDVNTAANDVAQAVDRVQGQLPPGASLPTIFKANPNAFPIMNIALTGGTLEQLYDTATNILQPALTQATGVASVQVQGGLVPQVSVVLNPTAMAAMGVSDNQVTQALSQQNVSIPGGNTTEGGVTRTIRTNAYFQSAAELRGLVIATNDGTPITLGEVATVTQGYAPINQVTTYNGQNAVGLVITAQSGANIIQVDKAVKGVLARYAHTLPQGMQTHIINDQTTAVKQSLAAVEHDLVLAVILPAIVLLLFLHRIRNMLIVVVAIPTSLISTFIVMYFLGFSLDLISLLALSLLTGILVDDSVVVLENINRHLSLGKNPVRAALDGRMEIGLAAVAITMTDVVVYMPMAFTSGLVGDVFREFGLTIVSATLFSLFVSFTLTPLLASRWLKEPMDLEQASGGGPFMRFARAWERGFHRVREAYGRLIGRALIVRPLVILIGVGALALSIAFIPLGWLGTEYVPQEDNGQFTVNIQLPNGTPVTRTETVVMQLDQEIRRMPGVVDTYASAGARGGFFGGANTNTGSIAVDLLPVGERPPIQTYVQRVIGLGRRFPDASVIAQVPSSLRIGGQRAVMVVLQGPDINVLNQLAEQVTTSLSKLPGVAQVRNQATQTVPELSVHVERAAAANLGVTPAQIGSAIQTAVAGTQAGYLQPNGSTLQTPIVVSVAGGPTMTPQELSQLTVSSATGVPVRLSQVAQITPSAEPAQLNDQNRQLEVTVGASTAVGVPLGTAVAEVQRAMRQLNLPEGYSYSLGGAAAQQAQVFAPLEGAFALSVLLVYMLTSALYESLLYPMAVLLSLPLATVGALTALTVTRNTLNLFSFMGLIMLMGLVAKNAILLVDYTNTLRSRGLGRREALIEAGKTRMRPIVMTTTTMVFAMMPLAVRIGSGSEDRSPMAIALIGGLITSTLLTLVFVPVVYTYLDDVGAWLTRRGWRRPPAWVARPAYDPDLDGPKLAEPVETVVRSTQLPLVGESGDGGGPRPPGA